jgi:hypothetical protein
MIAAFRHPTNASVTGLPSAVMKRPEAGSASIAVLGEISDACHIRSFRRPVSMTGPPGCARLTPGLRGTTIANSVPSVICTGIVLSGREIFESLPHRQNLGRTRSAGRHLATGAGQGPQREPSS